MPQPMHTVQIILASQSPRRGELLDQIGVVYRLGDTDIDEAMHSNEEAASYAARMAREKAESVGGQAGIPVLGADTVVVIDNRVLGKPGSRSEAKEMLASLSGRSHQVITAVALITPAGDCLQTINTTLVEFKPLSQAEINSCCDNGEPMDKAGAYGIQGLAAMYISRIDGSYSGVMGLPLFETAQLLRKAGIALPAD